MIATYLIISGLTLALVGFGGLIGQHIERKDWNNLIRSGKLPKPGKSWTYTKPE